MRMVIVSYLLAEVTLRSSASGGGCGGFVRVPGFSEPGIRSRTGSGPSCEQTLQFAGC